jgi:hypothetical protein
MCANAAGIAITMTICRMDHPFLPERIWPVFQMLLEVILNHTDYQLLRIFFKGTLLLKKIFYGFENENRL